MKNLKVAIAVLAISIASVLPASASNTEPTNKAVKKVLRTEIVSLLGHHNYDLKDATLKAEVSVMLNNQNELVVVDIASKHQEVSSYVKLKLNYKKVDVKGIKKGTVYRVPLTMTQSK